MVEAAENSGPRNISVLRPSEHTQSSNGLSQRRQQSVKFGPRRQPQQSISDRQQGKQKAVEVVVYPLRHLRALAVSNPVEQLLFPAETGFRIAADEQTNSLLVSATDQDHAQVKEIVQAFDVAGQTANPPQSTVQQQTNKNSVEIETGPADTVILKGSKENVAAAEQMLKQMSSQQLLDHSKSLPDKASNTSNPAQKKNLEALKQTVREHFDVRQRLQLAEIEFLKARLADRERRVRQKEKLKDRIINRRIESLLLDPADVEHNRATGATEHTKVGF